MKTGWALLTLAVLAPLGFAQRARLAPFERPNIVVIVVDDLGIDKLGAYGAAPAGVTAPCTPVMNAMAQDGVLFRNVWTNPFCSPSRSQILTGRHGFRTGIGSVVPSDADVQGLSAEYERLIPRDLLGYHTAAVGKWHLANSAQGLQHPLDVGFSSYSGSMFNLLRPPVLELPGGDGLDCSQPNGRYGYSHWVRTWDADGAGLLRQTCSTQYATEETVDDAIFQVQRLRAPWFLYLSFNAAHTPSHRPPARLRRTSGCPTKVAEAEVPAELGGTPDLTDAMVEVLDSELGRFLEALRAADPEAYVILISDNGSEGTGSQGQPGSCVDPERSKGTLFEGGIRVPLLITGPGVVPGEVETVVNSTDVYATVMELARLSASAEDSVSLVPYLRGDHKPRRQFVYAERFLPNLETPDSPFTLPFRPLFHLRTIRSQRFKLFRFTDLRGAVFEELFDLENDPCELVGFNGAFGEIDPDLLMPEARAEYFALRAKLIEMGVY